MGTLTAPVKGSGYWAACTARVAYLYWGMSQLLAPGFQLLAYRGGGGAESTTGPSTPLKYASLRMTSLLGGMEMDLHPALKYLLRQIPLRRVGNNHRNPLSR